MVWEDFVPFGMPRNTTGFVRGVLAVLGEVEVTLVTLCGVSRARQLYFDDMSAAVLHGVVLTPDSILDPSFKLNFLAREVELNH